MRLACAMGIFAVLSAVRRADATPSARLVYARSADAASCPDEPALRKAVAARFGYDPFFAWAKQTIVLQILRDGGRYTARVQLVDEQGLARGTREIRSDEENCSELFDAAALAISIALDASANTVAPPAEVVVQPSVLGVAPSVSQPPAPSVDSGLHKTAPVVAPTAPSPFRMGVDALAFVWVAPNLAPGIAAFGDFRARALSLGLELQTDVSIANPTLQQSFPSNGHVASALFAATLAPCVHYRAAFFCALGEMGWLQAWGWGVTTGGSEGALFVAAGGRGGVEWPLSGQLFVRVHADVLANLNGANFQLATETVWSARPVVGALGAGLGAPFP